MNKELKKHIPTVKDRFTAELSDAVDNILARMSGEQMDRLLKEVDHTFSNQITPQGEPLCGPSALDLSGVFISAGGGVTAKAEFYAPTETIKIVAPSLDKDKPASKLKEAKSPKLLPAPLPNP